MARRAVHVKLALLGLVLLVAAAGVLRLVAGPVSLRGYSDSVADALADRIGPGWTVKLADTEIRLRGSRPAVRATGLEIRNPAGVPVVRAPEATVTLDPGALLLARLSPREISLSGLQLIAVAARDGSLSFVSEGSTLPGEAAAPATRAPAPAPPPEATRPDASNLSHAVWSLLDPVLRSSSLVGALDRAFVTDARLTLTGEEGGARIVFTDVSASFEHRPAGRRMEIRLRGPNGPWSLSGEARQAGSRREADLDAADVPLDDLLRGAGLGGLPAGSDVRLSGRISTAIDSGRLERLEGRLESQPGFITPPGQPTFRLDRLVAEAAWDENAGRIDLRELALTSGKGRTALSGTVQPGADGSWRMALSGRGSELPGILDADGITRIDQVALAMGFTPGGVVLDRLDLKGDKLDVSVTGGTTAGPAGNGLSAVITGRDTDVRRFFALWPGAVNPELRGFLGQNLKAGTLSRIRLETDLDPADLAAAFSGKPISDKGLKLSFALQGARITVIDGLPPLRDLDIDGGATGTTTTLAAKQGRIEMPDGRRLSFLDGTYFQADEHLPNSMAKIGFRIEGGADGVASFLRSPIFKELGSFEIDPATVRGRADLKVAMGLTVHHIPPVADIPLTVSGSFQDVSMERVFGREKLEGANLAVLYEKGALSIRGDGKLGGSPAAFDIRQPRAGGGEAAVTLTLDEAARSRRSLPAGPQVAGPVTARVLAPFGPGAKGPIRVEADLSKATIDGLLPGWNKPAGRPGRLAFVIAEGDASDLRDVVVESGPVQIKGHATLAADGSLDKADLPVLKLSPGDDMRATVDKQGGGYRIALRGNVGDARPVLRWMSGSSGPPGSAPKGKEPPDLDIEASVAIVTGHNDEAMTGVNARIATRGRDLRALQLRGQFRQAVLDASLGRRDGAASQVLTLRSGDAGATLRFLDLYKRMVGGDLVVQTSIGDVQAGNVTIAGFAIRNEPALRRIAAAPVPMPESDRATGGTPLAAEQVDFVKLTGEFRRTANRVEYKDVVVWGPQVGFNLSGTMDFARERTDILGTFVPAYGLNNAFSQLPIVGLILGGNRNEGLIAIDFRIQGPMASPTLHVNPLTVVAPGILRKLFGWMLPDDEATGATGTEPERPAPRAAAPRRNPR